MKRCSKIYKTKEIGINSVSIQMDRHIYMYSVREISYQNLVMKCMYNYAWVFSA